ncbi:modulator of macroautophagy TMEM150B isoform X1 [Monodelphis domestica]|uniref:modulator of macroautophagy TMEM150B isoform X1 n=1 Tax=Monodelphis domestica TaxID=13616 RepID=UPI0024E236F2|nr:modulator of macroautophagy TMEM150B isoform X1 [Monodelphis domestica]
MAPLLPHRCPPRDVGLPGPAPDRSGSVGYSRGLDDLCHGGVQQVCEPHRGLSLHQPLRVLPSSELRIRPAPERRGRHGGLDLPSPIPPAPGMGSPQASQSAVSGAGLPLCLGGLHRGQLPENQRALHASIRGLPGLRGRGGLLLGPAASAPPGQASRPARRPLDRAPAPAALWGLHRPHGGHGGAALVATAVRRRRVRVVRGHAPVRPLRPLGSGLLPPGRPGPKCAEQVHVVPPKHGQPGILLATAPLGTPPLHELATLDRAGPRPSLASTLPRSSGATRASDALAPRPLRGRTRGWRGYLDPPGRALGSPTEEEGDKRQEAEGAKMELFISQEQIRTERRGRHRGRDKERGGLGKRRRGPPGPHPIG